MSPTTAHPFVADTPRHVRLKLSATYVAEAYVRSNMRDLIRSWAYTVHTERVNTTNAMAPAMRNLHFILHLFMFIPYFMPKQAQPLQILYHIYRPNLHY